MGEALGLNDGWVPLGFGALLAATCLIVAFLMTFLVGAQSSSDTACDGRMDGAVLLYKQSELWPPGTTCGYRDRETQEVREVTLVPWEPMRWLVPGLAIAAPVFLLLGLAASARNVRRAGRPASS